MLVDEPVRALNSNASSSIIDSLWMISTQWLDSAYIHFHPWSEFSESHMRSRLQAIARLAQFFDAAYESELNPLPDSLQRAWDFLEQVGHDPTFLELVNRIPRQIEHFLLVARTLARYGRPIPNYRPFIQARIRHGHIFSTERAAHRLLLLRALLDDMGFEHTMPAFATLYQQVILTHRPLLVLLKPIDLQCVVGSVYALHIAQNRQDTPVPRVDFQAFARTFRTLMSMIIRSPEVNVLSVMLAHCYLLAGTPAALQTAAWRKLAEQIATAVPEDNPEDQDYFESNYSKYLAIMTAVIRHNYQSRTVGI